MVREALRAGRGRRRLTAAALALAGLLLLAQGEALAQSAPDTIARVKRSIVAVGTYERLRSPQFAFSGTGFVVGDGRMVATNKHVVPAALGVEQDEKLVVALPGAERGAELRAAREIATGTDADLALLAIDGKPLPALALGDSSRVREGERYLFTGFPIGTVLGLIPVTHRAMVSARTPIVIPALRADRLDARTVRRIKLGSFTVFQLDATAYPGNSGSPVYDPATGRVIGVINSVFVKGTKESALQHPSGITYAIPAKRLKKLLERH